MDVMGRVRLSDGTELSVVTGIDDHSRFCVSALLVPRATARPVCQALVGAMRAHGIPDAVLTDNCKVFTGRFGVTKTEVLFDRICRENGVRHLLTAPYSPTTTGKVERLHKTMRAEFFTQATAATPPSPSSSHALDAWVDHYNTRASVTSRRRSASPSPNRLRQDHQAQADQPPTGPDPAPTRGQHPGGDPPRRHHRGGQLCRGALQGRGQLCPTKRARCHRRRAGPDHPRRRDHPHPPHPPRPQQRARCARQPHRPAPASLQPSPNPSAKCQARPEAKVSSGYWDLT